MWVYEHSIETEAIYRLYSEVERWMDWDTGLERITLEGPFAAGSTGTIVQAGQGAFPFRLTEVTPNKGFTDETGMVEMSITLRFIHTLVPIEGARTRVTHRVEIAGLAAEELGPQIGPQVTADTPEAMALLVQRALEL
jgi:hypothetical protein